MAQLTLDPKTTALVVIDLQKGIVGMPTVPYPAADVVTRAAKLAKHFREKGATVILVHVDTGPNGMLFPRVETDAARPQMAPSPDFAQIVPELGPEKGDVVVTKHQPSAFFGTDLEVQLRRRGIQTIVLCGIATSMGVESTARTGFEHGFNLVFVEDAMTNRDEDLHRTATTKYFPGIGRVRKAEEISVG